MDADPLWTLWSYLPRVSEATLPPHVTLGSLGAYLAPFTGRPDAARTLLALVALLALGTRFSLGTLWSTGVALGTLRTRRPREALGLRGTDAHWRPTETATATPPDWPLMA